MKQYARKNSTKIKQYRIDTKDRVKFLRDEKKKWISKYLSENNQKIRVC